MGRRRPDLQSGIGGFHIVITRHPGADPRDRDAAAPGDVIVDVTQVAGAAPLPSGGGQQIPHLQRVLQMAIQPGLADARMDEIDHKANNCSLSAGFWLCVGRLMCETDAMAMNIDLTGKTVLLTGASKGIGAATAAMLGDAGAHLVAHYGSDRAGAETATAAIPADRKRLVAADLGDMAAVAALWQAAVAWRGRVDVLVNNAAVMDFTGGFDADDAHWDAVWDRALAVNVKAPARLMRDAVNHFRAMGGGTIISISSWAAQRGVTNPATIAYGASKAAVRAATQSVARAYARDGVLAYIVAPGVVRTRLSEQFAATQGGEDKISAGLASGEWVTPDELGRLVAFLASGAVPQMSGATVDVNGASYIR